MLSLPTLPAILLQFRGCAYGLAFACGFRGLPFLLDDWSTLPKLGTYGPVDNPLTFVGGNPL
jgi:hypothetical protein